MVNMICIGNTIFKTLSSVHGWINLWSRRRVIELVADDKLGMCGRCGRATHPQHSIDKSDLVRQLLDDWLIANSCNRACISEVETSPLQTCQTRELKQLVKIVKNPQVEVKYTENILNLFIRRRCSQKVDQLISLYNFIHTPSLFGQFLSEHSEGNMLLFYFSTIELVYNFKLKYIVVMQDRYYLLHIQANSRDLQWQDYCQHRS